MPKVSIVTPTYNMAQYLPAAIESALSQDYPDKEIIVLDDGSTDGTAEVVRGYGDRVRYFWQPNEGVASAYNQLISLSSGDYVHVLDADDVLLPGAVSRGVAMLDVYPNAAFVYGPAVVINHDGQAYGRRSAPAWIARAGCVSSREAFRELLQGCHVTNSTVMLRRSVLDEVGPYQPESVPGEDWQMWLRIVSRYDMAYSPETAALYRTHAGSITAGYTFDNVFRSHLFTIERIFADPDFRYASMRSYAFACLHRTVAAVAARGRHRRAFAGHFAAAVRSYPPILRDRRTCTVVAEGVKTLFPPRFIVAGKSVRHALFGRWSTANG
jgi:glycosyltransferase involved in cell wall biosynthesis